MKWRVKRYGKRWQLITGEGNFVDKDKDALQALTRIHNRRPHKRKRAKRR